VLRPRWSAAAISVPAVRPKFIYYLFLWQGGIRFAGDFLRFPFFFPSPLMLACRCRPLVAGSVGRYTAVSHAGRTLGTGTFRHECTLLGTHVPTCSLCTHALAHNTYDQPTKQEAGSSGSHNTAAPAEMAASGRPTIATENPSLAPRTAGAMHCRFGRETSLLRRQDGQQFLQPVVTFEWLESIGGAHAGYLQLTSAIERKRVRWRASNGK